MRISLESITKRLMVAKRKTAVKKKQTPKEKGVCFDCLNAYLMQSSKDNPIVAECSITKDREVARMFICQNGCFKRIIGDERLIHPMVKLN